MTTPKQAIVLARISDFRGDEAEPIVEGLDDVQADSEALSPGARDQLADIRKHLGRLGWEIGSEATHVLVEDDTSAFKRRKIRLPNGRHELRTVRPKFRRAIEMLASGQADGMCVLDLDRACRDPRDLEDLIDVVESRTPRVPVDSLTGSLKLANDADVTMARVQVAIANKSSRDTARRVSRTRRRQAEEGRNGGGIRRFGWEKDGITVREDEAAVIAELADKVLGGASMHSLARMMRERGIPPVAKDRKRPWDMDDVRRLVRNPSNAGLRSYKGELIRTAEPWWNRPAHPGRPIIDRETWEAVRVKLSDASRRTSPGNKPRWFGSGLYLCGHQRCEGTGHAVSVRFKSAGARQYPAYACREFSHATRDAVWLDAYVADVIVERLKRPDAIELLRPETSDDTSALSNRLAALREQIGEAKQLWRDGVFSPGELRTETQRLNDEIADIESQLAAASGTDPLAGIAGRPDARDVWDSLELAAQRAIMSTLMTVTILPKPRGRMSDERKREFVRIDWK